MKIKQTLLSTLLLVMFSNFSMAQKLLLENVQKVTLSSSGAIKQATDVKGYYFFYVSDKID